MYTDRLNNDKKECIYRLYTNTFYTDTPFTDILHTDTYTGSFRKNGISGALD